MKYGIEIFAMIKNLWRNRNLQILGNIGSGHHKKKTEMKEKIPQENEKTTKNQTKSEVSNHRDKSLGFSPCKILGNILKVDKGRTSINEPGNKKTHVDV